MVYAYILTFVPKKSKLQLLYYHHFNGSMVAWRILMLLKKGICEWKFHAKRGWKEMEDSPMLIWKEKMNAGFAWSLAPKWSCLIVVIQCASNAIAIGNYCFNFISLMLLMLTLLRLDINRNYYLLSWCSFQIAGTQDQSPALFVVAA